MSDSVPDGWAMMEFDRFTTLQRGKDLTKAEFRDGTVPVAGSNGVIGYHDTAIAKAPGITVGRSGSAGKVTVYEKDFWPHNTSLYVRDFHGNDPYFAGFLLGSLNLARFKTGASVPTLDRNSFKTLPILVPPLPEQKKIAHILSTVQRAIEAQERIVQTTTALKKALMHKLFTEGLRNEPQKQTEIGPIPKSWDVVELGTLFAKQPQNGLYKPKKDYGSGTQILRIDDFSNDGDVVTSAGNLVELARSEIETYGLEPGDIVINRVNSVSHLGKTALIGDITQEMVFESNMMRFSVDESQVQKEYVFKYLNSPLTKKQIIGSAKRAVAQSSINQGDVKAIIVPKPSRKEQGEIVAALAATEAKIAHSSDKGSVLRDLFRTLLHELMTAKTRVRELELHST